MDDNTGKINTYSPGYHLPVFSSKRLIEDKPDIIVILAWRFEEEILKKLEFFQGIVVIPLPIFKEI